MERIYVTFADDEKAHIEALCKKWGRSRSAVVRLLARKAMEHGVIDDSLTPVQPKFVAAEQA